VKFDLVTGLEWYLVFLFSTSFHEAAHAWTAWKLGDDTAHRGGQVTLDPTPHIYREPLGMVVVPILSYVLGGWMIGWASAPFDPNWAAANPKRSALMSLAGPAANLILLLLAALLIRGGVFLDYFQAPPSVTFSHMVAAVSPAGRFWGTLLSIVFSLNLLLGAFNLLPVPPLDGSGALLMFAEPHSAGRLLSILRGSQWRFLGLFLAWKVFGAIYPWIQITAVNLLYLGQSHYQ
jgi:Zn-dependent protease